ncbi:MAG: hypothetical protein ILO34_04105 [Kiritimatiellae bacterium]|nr:hypothetical protein [Kiritimatiellia bacterium]
MKRIVAIGAGLVCCAGALAEPMVKIGDRTFDLLNTHDGYDWEYDRAVTRCWQDGDTVESCRDLYDYRYIDGALEWGPTGGNMKFDIGDGGAIRWDFCGFNLVFHETVMFVHSGAITFCGGILHQLGTGGGGRSFVWEGAGATIVLEDDFELRNWKEAGVAGGDAETGYNERVIYSSNADTDGCRFVIDGATVSSTYFYDFDALGDDCAIVVKGSSVVNLLAWNAWSAGPESFKVKMEGGWWSLDPNSCNRRHMGASCFVADFGDDHGDLPARYRVFDCIAGWTLDSRRDFGLVLPACTVDSPGSAIAVEVKGELPEGRTLLADLSNLEVVGSPLEFVSADNAVKIVYSGDCLYARPAEAGGLFIFVK